MKAAPLGILLLAASLVGQAQNAIRGYEALPSSALPRVATVQDPRRLPARSVPTVPRSVADADARLEVALRDLARGVTGDRIVAVGRFAAVLDAATRTAARERIARIARKLSIDPAAEGPIPGSAPDPTHFTLDHAFRLADRFLTLGPDSDEAALDEALTKDPWMRLAALHRCADTPSIAGALRGRIQDQLQPVHWRFSPMGEAIRVAAARCLLTLPIDEPSRRAAVATILEDGELRDRRQALRAAAEMGSMARPLLRRVMYRLSSTDDEEAMAALLAMAAIGLPPRDEWPTRRDLFRTLSSSPDADARAAARFELDWRGPWLDESLTCVAALANDRAHPEVARLATIVHAQLRRRLDSNR